MVKENSYMLDSIEMNVGTAKNYMGKAIGRLGDAKKSDQAAHK